MLVKGAPGLFSAAAILTGVAAAALVRFRPVPIAFAIKYNLLWWIYMGFKFTSWRHQMETLPTLLSLYEGNPPVTGGFPSQRPATRSIDVFDDVGLHKLFSKQSRCRWFETPWLSLWRQCHERMAVPSHTWHHSHSIRLCSLTNRGRDKMAAISQTTLSNVFS